MSILFPKRKNDDFGNDDDDVVVEEVQIRPDDSPTVYPEDVRLNDILELVTVNNEILEATVDAVNVIGEKLSTLVVLLKSGGGTLSSVTSDEVNDMAVVMQVQQHIIQSILQSKSIPEEVRENIGTELMNIKGWTEMEKAQKRIQDRVNRRNSLELMNGGDEDDK